MKDRTREAVFNLVGPAVKGKYAVDLFGGTGAIGLEAISRGAVGATFVERHHPTAHVLQKNVAALELTSICEVVEADTFLWFKRGPSLPETPWVVFVCPPYDFFIERTAQMLELIEQIWEQAPPESVMVVEADDRFEFRDWPLTAEGDTRVYAPAVVNLLRKK